MLFHRTTYWHTDKYILYTDDVHSQIMAMYHLRNDKSKMEKQMRGSVVCKTSGEACPTPQVSDVRILLKVGSKSFQNDILWGLKFSNSSILMASLSDESRV